MDTDRTTQMDSDRLGQLPELLAFCNSQAAWLRETIEVLVRLESPSDDKAAVDRCGDELERRLTEMGTSVERLRQAARGDHLRARWGRGKGEREKGQGKREDRPILVLGHFDTVWPVGSLEKMPLHEANGRLYGPGIFDMKAGIAIAMLALRAIDAVALPEHVQVVMMWTTDEEIGSATS